MPVISYFFGICIRMYHDDHNPPHFHAEYQGHEAIIDLRTGELLRGSLPRKAAKIIKEWTAENQDELLKNWAKAIELEPLTHIKGADND